MPAPVQNLLSSAQRASVVVSTLIRFGFGEFVSMTGLDRFLPGGDKLENSPLHSGTVPERVRMVMEELGPTFIKAGQILSTRPDLIPPEWIEEFRKLQSDVPPSPWEGEHGVQELLRDEYGEELDEYFASIDPEPIAGASIAQVHVARLADGTEVVLKVLRPGIRETIHADLDLSRRFIKLVGAHLENLGFDAQAVIEEFSHQLKRETDLTLEAASTERMRRDFEGVDNIRFPKVYEDLSTRSVLVLEKIEGTLLSKLDVETLSQDERANIVRNGADMVFRQCLEIGFFHADPHPGNIFVLDDQKLCFIDCGMTGLIDPLTMGQLAQIVHGAVGGDLERVLATTILLADAPPHYSQDREFRSDVWGFVDRFHGGSAGSICLGELLGEFFGVLRKHKLRCPADIVYLIKALTTIEGVAESTAPSFDLVGYVRPHVEHLVRRRYSPEFVLKRFEAAFMSYSDLVESLPRHISEISRAIRQNRVAITLEHKDADRFTREIERASMHIAWALVVAAMLIGSALLAIAGQRSGDKGHMTTIAIWGFVVAIGLAVFRLVSTFKRL